MSMFRQIRPGGFVRTAGITALLCLALPAFAAKAGGGASDAYSYAELLLDDLKAVPEYELGPKQYLLVIGAFEKVAEKHPKNRKTDRSLFVTAELYESLGERFKNEKYLDKAVALYRSLAARFPNSPYGEKAVASLRELGEEAPATAVAQAKGPAPRPTPTTPVEDTAGAIARPAKFASRSAGGPTIVRTMRHWAHADYTRVVIELDDATDVRFDRIQNPDRLYFDFVGSRLDKPLRPLAMIEVGGELLRGIRAGQNRRDVARVVLDLTMPAHFTASWLANPPRLVVELRREPPQVLAEKASEPELLAAATSVEEILPAPRDTFAKPILSETRDVNLDSVPVGAREPGSRPSVTSEEIVPEFLEQPAGQSPVRERFEPARAESVAPAKRAVRGGAAHRSVETSAVRLGRH